MRLKEHGSAQLGLHSQHRGVEALKMAGLQDPAVLFGENDKFLGLRQRCREWFFDEQIEPGIKERRSHRVVMHRGNRDRGRVDVKIRREQFID
jgi:hypothetical protein